ncbi:MAG: hypothetical protein ABIV25_03775, partial [Paracoccaceae bacterium]
QIEANGTLAPTGVDQHVAATLVFEGEIAESMRCIRAGLFESPVMPLDETVAVAGWMDAIRARLGVHYPFD